MRIIQPNEIKQQINNCYENYDPNWPATIGNDDVVRGFKHYLEQTGGFKLDFDIDIMHGQVGYRLKSAEIVDESAFMVWMLKWS